MSLSAKKYFEVIKYVECNECEFYHPGDGYCEKLQYQKKAYCAICRQFALSMWAAYIHDMTEAERKEFNALYKKNNENA